MTFIEARQVEGSAQDPSVTIMTPWTFDVKFSLDTQFTFRSLTFVVEGDEDLMMLPPGPVPERLASTDGQAPWSLMISSISGGACLGLDPFIGFYIRIAKIIQGIPIVTSTL
jgi:hypothetical protein